MSRSHKYISRKWKNGKWTYYYDQPKTKKTSVPDGYDPHLTKSTYGKRQGYTSRDGLFYDGDYETAREKAYKRDLDNAQLKAEQQFEDQKYRNSARRHFDDTVKDVQKFSQNTVAGAKNSISKGKKKVASLLRKMANKIE